MNETDITILKLSEAGRAALAKLAALDALCEQQTRTITLTSERAVKAEKDLAVARELLEVRTAERDAAVARNIILYQEKEQEAEEARVNRVPVADFYHRVCEVLRRHNVDQAVFDDVQELDGLDGTEGGYSPGLETTTFVYRERLDEAIRARDEVGIQLAAAQERLGLAMAVVDAARVAHAMWLQRTPRLTDHMLSIGSALIALDAVPGDALATP
jgi:hypothetical protein